jgi:GNAT superfamily N-acetyltransferase
VIRTATAEDVPAIHRLVCELAEYERARHDVEATPEQLREALFGPDPTVFAHVAETASTEHGAGEVVGFALWFLNFSTWRGRNGIYLEDLYVQPEHRGSGLGRELLTELARICVERGYARLEWSVLDWNEPARGFYRSLGAVSMDEWTVFRLTGDALARLGSAGTGA